MPILLSQSCAMKWLTSNNNMFLTSHPAQEMHNYCAEMVRENRVSGVKKM